MERPSRPRRFAVSWVLLLTWCTTLLVGGSMGVVSQGLYRTYRAESVGGRSELAAAPYQPREQGQEKQKTMAAIVIDDLGLDLEMARKFCELEIPVTLAILPYQRHGRRIASEALRHGKETILHLPLQPRNYPEVNPGTGALLLSMDREQVQACGKTAAVCSAAATLYAAAIPPAREKTIVPGIRRGLRRFRIRRRALFDPLHMAVRARGWNAVILLVCASGTMAPAWSATDERPGLPPLDCQAEQTGGFHDDPGGEESYAPALFHPQRFTLEENVVFMMNLGSVEGNADLYLTMTREVAAAEGEAPVVDETELECRRVRGANDAVGYSCVNVPPSEMLLLNATSLRFTRTAVGGWTFSGPAAATAEPSEAEAPVDPPGGDSIFVEFGQCVAAEPGGSAP